MSASSYHYTPTQLGVFAIGIVGCYKGFNTKKGTEGVGQASHSSVVVASLMIFIIDLLAVQITDIMGLN